MNGERGAQLVADVGQHPPPVLLVDPELIQHPLQLRRPRLDGMLEPRLGVSECRLSSRNLVRHAVERPGDVVELAAAAAGDPMVHLAIGEGPCAGEQVPDRAADIAHEHQQACGSRAQRQDAEASASSLKSWIR
jgi:hypothetical protein